MNTVIDHVLFYKYLTKRFNYVWVLVSSCFVVGFVFSCVLRTQSKFLIQSLYLDLSFL